MKVCLADALTFQRHVRTTSAHPDGHLPVQVWMNIPRAIGWDKVMPYAYGRCSDVGRVGAAPRFVVPSHKVAMEFCVLVLTGCKIFSDT